ncbi:hypothetical protein WA158_001517 [Blastocystis sp. Blastoise]
MQEIQARWKTKGLVLKGEWLQQQINNEQLLSKTIEQQDTYLLNKILFCDLSILSEPTLPTGIAAKDTFHLNGSYIVQILGCSNICEPEKKQFNDGATRLLKLKLSDGYQNVFAIEYKKVPHLLPTIAIGTKLCIKDILVAGGLLLFEPEKVIILGGEFQ